MTVNHVHGTLTEYVLYGCRCRPCTDANLTHAREYRLVSLLGKRWMEFGACLRSLERLYEALSRAQAHDDAVPRRGRPVSMEAAYAMATRLDRLERRIDTELDRSTVRLLQLGLERRKAAGVAAVQEGIPA